MRAALATFLAACALGGGEGGGSDALPVSGAGPYAKLSDFAGKTPLDEPYVVVDPLADVTDPAPLVLPDGRFRIFYTRGGRDLLRVDLPPSLKERPSDPELVVAGGTAPTAARQGGRLLLYYQTPAGIARAVSTDDGATVSDDGVVLPGAAAPGVLVADGQVFLYHTLPGEKQIRVAVSADGLAFAPAEVALAPSGVRFAYDEASVGDPAPAGGETAAGELHVGLFFTATNGVGTTAIGYAGSRDGLHFEAEATPVMDPKEPSESAPAAILEPTRAVLLFTQNRSGKLAIGAATQP